MIERIELLIAEMERFDDHSQVMKRVPYMIQTLNQLLMLYKSDHPDKDILRGVGLGLGRFVMDDYHFSEGPVGSKLMDLANDIIRENKK